MKTCVRIGTLVIALGLAGLFSGCVSQSSSGYDRQPARDFEVVETSTKRQLTDREMAYLRAKVDAYLKQQGQTGSGDYYVKIYLAEEEGVAQSEWVIVRYSRYPTTRFSLVASYPTYSYPSYPYYSYDYYPFGWYGFSGLSFRYYDNPYYYGYYPRYTGHWRDRDRKPDHRHDHDRDDDKDDDQPRTDRRPSGGLKPSFVPANMNRNRPNDAPPTVATPAPGHRRDDFPQVGNRPNSRVRRNHPTSPGLANTIAPVGPTVAPRVSQPSYRPGTRSVLHREHGPADATQPIRAEVTERRSFERRERTYTPPAAPARTQSYDGSRSRESSRQEPSPNYNPPATRSDSGSSQPATRSVLDGGRRGEPDP